jgi:hypothetical protein
VACSCMCELSLRMGEDLPLFHHTSSWFGVQFTIGTTSPLVNEYQNQWECKVKRNAFGNSKFYVFSVGVYVHLSYHFSVIRVRDITTVEYGRVAFITDTFSSCLRLAWLSDNIKNVCISGNGIIWHIWA